VTAPWVAARMASQGNAPGGATPSGYEVIRNTPDGGRVMRRASDNKLVFVSPGFSTTDPTQIEKIMSAGSESPRSLKESEIRQEMVRGAPASAATLKFAQGLPFVGEYLDEAVGLVDDKAQRQMRAMQDAMEQEYPKTSLGLRVGGALTAAPVMAVRSTASAGGTAATRAMQEAVKQGVFGAAEGTVSGYGAGTDAESREALARRGAVFGGGGGFGGGLLGSFVGSATSRSAMVGRELEEVAQALQVSKDAAAVILETVRNGGTVRDGVEQIIRAGDDAMLADAGPEMAALVDAVSQTTGGARARGAIVARADAASRSISPTLDELLGPPPVGRQTVEEAVQARTAPERSAAYTEAYAQPVPYLSPAGDAIEDVLRRTPPDVISRATAAANRRMLVENQPNQQMRVTISPSGRASFEEMPNTIQLDYLKRALDTMGRSQDTTFGDPQLYRTLARQLRSSLGDAIPGYNRAVALGGETILDREAADIGFAFLAPKTTREDVLRALSPGNTSKTQQDAMRLGFRNALEETLANVKTTITGGEQTAIAEARRLLADMSSRASIGKMELLLGRDQASELLGRLGPVRKALETMADTAPNSKTAVRQQVIAMLDDMVTKGPVRALARGEPVEMTRRMTQWLTGQTDDALQSQRQDILRQIGEALTRRGDNRSTQEAYKLLQAAVAGQDLSTAQAQFLTRMAGVSGGLGGSEAAQVEGQQ
jgi:hypothetical protein